MPSQVGWENYGGRGIIVSMSWRTFENFLADMGEQPDGLTIERDDPNGPYSRENCCWDSPLVQARNKRNTRWLTYADETLCLAEWAERLGIRPKTLRARIDDHGWTVERALSAPVMTSRQAAHNAQEVRYGRVKLLTNGPAA